MTAPLATSSTSLRRTTPHGAPAACTMLCVRLPHSKRTPTHHHQGAALSSKTKLASLNLGPDEFVVWRT